MIEKTSNLLGLNEIITVIFGLKYLDNVWYMLKNIYVTGGGWFCDHVMVKCGDDADEVMYFFPCGKWLDKGQEDGKIERELKPAEPPKQSSKLDYLEIVGSWNSNIFVNFLSVSFLSIGVLDFALAL